MTKKIKLVAAFLSLLQLETAHAADECGPEAAGFDTIICSAGNYAGGGVFPNFPSGIDYTSPDGLSLVVDTPTATVDNPGIRLFSAVAGTGNVSVVGDSLDTISTNSVFSSGITVSVQNAVSTGNAFAQLRSGNIVTTGNDSMGLQVVQNGLGNAEARMDGGTIQTSGQGSPGNGAHGLAAAIQNAGTTANAQVLVTGGDITTAGQNAIGGLAIIVDGLGSPMAQMDGGTITTSGDESWAIGTAIFTLANVAPSNVIMNDGGIITSGNGSHGLLSITNGQGSTRAQMDGGSVSTSGFSSFGVASGITNPAASADAEARINAGSISTTGQEGNGVIVQNAGTGAARVIVSGTSSITASGVDAAGVAIQLLQPGASFVVAVNDSASVIGGQAAAIATLSAPGSTGTIDIATDATVDGTTNGMAAIFDAAGDATVNILGTATGAIVLSEGSDSLTLDSTDLSGLTLLDGGDDVSVADGFIDVLRFVGSSALLVGSDVTNWESVIIDTGSVISFAGNNTLTTGTLGVNSGGTLSIQNGSVTDALNVDGSFTGGGVLNMDVTLDDGTTDSTDTVVVTGDTSGVTTVNIANVGGVGADTGNEPTDGILIISVDGASDPGAFVLAGGSVSAGEFTYVLLHNPDDGNWYLQTAAPALSVPAGSSLNLLLLALMLCWIGIVALTSRGAAYSIR